MQNKLFVRNLSFKCDESALRELFTQFGEVTSAKIAIDHATGKGRGFGFVEMASKQDAQAAINGLEGTDFGGRTIHVAVSEPREKRTNAYSSNRW